MRIGTLSSDSSVSASSQTYVGSSASACLPLSCVPLPLSAMSAPVDGRGWSGGEDGGGVRVARRWVMALSTLTIIDSVTKSTSRARRGLRPCRVAR